VAPIAAVLIVIPLLFFGLELIILLMRAFARIRVAPGVA
jgi:hypothetical protein